MINLENTINTVYEVEFYYDGDDTSDFTGKYIVVAKNETEAIEKAKKESMRDPLFMDKNPWHYYVYRKYTSLESYKRKFPRNNSKIIK